jgi:hypothetical protein
MKLEDIVSLVRSLAGTLARGAPCHRLIPPQKRSTFTLEIQWPDDDDA